MNEILPFQIPACIDAFATSITASNCPEGEIMKEYCQLHKMKKYQCTQRMSGTSTVHQPSVNQQHREVGDKTLAVSVVMLCKNNKIMQQYFTTLEQSGTVPTLEQEELILSQQS